MKEYFEHSSVSQSQLKSLLIHPRAFKEEKETKLYFEEKVYFTIGSAVDFKLTEDESTFTNFYHISNVLVKPSDTIKSIIHQVFDALKEQFTVEEIGLISDVTYRLLILQACESHNYQNRWNSDTKISKICEFYEYWEDLKASEGKILLSQEEDLLISTIVMSLKTNKATSVYFNAEEVHYQVPIYFEYDGVPCKALLDMVIFDRENKTIQPIDIKTTGEYTINFPKALKRMRYDIQAAFYTEALRWLYPEYEILPFKFIVESTKDPGQPLVFICDKELLWIGKNGRKKIFLQGDTIEEKSFIDTRTIYYEIIAPIKGFVQLLELYKYYNENGYEMDKIVREGNSELTIGWSGIII